MADPATVLSGVLDSTPDAQYQRGSGPDALQYGDAAALNDASVGLPTTPTSAAPPAPAPSGATGAQPGEAAFTPTTDAEKYLTAPSANQRPAQPLQGLNLNDFGDWVMPLAEAANRPDAAPATKALFNAIMLGPLP